MDCSTPGFLSFTLSQSLLKLMSTESAMPSNPLILCHPLLFLPSTFPALGSFPMSQLFTSGGQNIIEASASVLPMNIQGWLPLGLIGLISLLPKELKRVFFSTTVWKHHFKWLHSILQIHCPWFDYSLTVGHLCHVSCITTINNEYPCTELFVHLNPGSNKHLLSFCKCIPLRVQEDKTLTFVEYT